MFTVILAMFLLDSSIWVLNIYDTINNTRLALSSSPQPDYNLTGSMFDWPIAKFLSIPIVGSISFQLVALFTDSVP